MRFEIAKQSKCHVVTSNGLNHAKTLILNQKSHEILGSTNLEKLKNGLLQQAATIGQQ